MWLACDARQLHQYSGMPDVALKRKHCHWFVRVRQRAHTRQMTHGLLYITVLSVYRKIQYTHIRFESLVLWWLGV